LAHPVRPDDLFHMNAKPTITPHSETAPAAARPTPLESTLARHAFLQGLNPHQIRLLSDCAMPVKFGPGELIFREGDPANRFYLINRGSIAIESHVQDRGVTRIQTVAAGEVLGWSWLFPPYYWHFDARAVETTEAIFFYATPLRVECEADHDLGYELIKRMAEIMMKRLQATRQQLLKLHEPLRAGVPGFDPPALNLPR
jgi:CRP/FNR family cyclic AMP-dependent transcriptional regulator